MYVLIYFSSFIISSTWCMFVEAKKDLTFLPVLADDFSIVLTLFSFILNEEYHCSDGSDIAKRLSSLAGGVVMHVLFSAASYHSAGPGNEPEFTLLRSAFLFFSLQWSSFP